MKSDTQRALELTREIEGLLGIVSDKLTVLNLKLEGSGQPDWELGKKFEGEINWLTYYLWELNEQLSWQELEEDLEVDEETGRVRKKKVATKHWTNLLEKEASSKEDYEMTKQIAELIKEPPTEGGELLAAKIRKMWNM